MMSQAEMRNYIAQRCEPVTESGCWIWLGGETSSGHGKAKIAGVTTRKAHRISWLAKHGSLPKQLMCHKCNTPLCVNPDHLYIGTHKSNAQDKKETIDSSYAAGLECLHGHPMKEGDDSIYVTPQGYKVCRRCRLIRSTLSNAERDGNTERIKQMTIPITKGPKR